MSDARHFRTLYGTYLSHQNGYLIAVPIPDHSCRFHFEWHYDKVALRTHHSHYVGVNHLHAVYTTSHAHESQKFILERVADGRVAFRSSHGTYIRVEPNGSVRAHHRIEAGELFIEEVAPVIAMTSAVVATAPPVMMAPPMVAPPPVMMQPQPVMAPPPVVYAQPPPVYAVAPPVVVAPQPQTVIVQQRSGPSALGVGLAVAGGLALGYEIGHMGGHHHHHHHHGHHRHHHHH